MLFTEITFWYLFALVTGLLVYNQVKLRSLKAQNTILLVASYTFYGAWDYRFLLLIGLVSAQTYVLGTMIIRARNQVTARQLTSVSVTSMSVSDQLVPVELSQIDRFRLHGHAKFRFYTITFYHSC